MDVLKIVQGDSFEGEIELIGLDAPNVEKLEFICPSLDLAYEMEQSFAPEVWTLIIPYEDTKELRVGRFLYKLVAKLFSGRIMTIVYDAELEVSKKVNTWTEVQ